MRATWELLSPSLCPACSSARPDKQRHSPSHTGSCSGCWSWLLLMPSMIFLKLPHEVSVTSWGRDYSGGSAIQKQMDPVLTPPPGAHPDGNEASPSAFHTVTRCVCSPCRSGYESIWPAPEGAGPGLPPKNFKSFVKGQRDTTNKSPSKGSCDWGFIK